MANVIEELTNELRRAADQVLSTLHEWNGLSFEGACNVRQLVATILAASDEDLKVLQSSPMEEAARNTTKERVQAILDIRETFEASLGVACNMCDSIMHEATSAFFAKQIVEEQKYKKAIEHGFYVSPVSGSRKQYLQ